jgi:hypothetical protein
MRIVLEILMVLHGVAHVPGFVGSWRLATLEGVPYHTTLLGGHLDVGDGGMRVVGAVWLLTALAFGATAAGALGNRSWWVSLALGAVVMSAALSILEWPIARAGLLVNLVILGIVAAGSRLHWLGAAA